MKILLIALHKNTLFTPLSLLYLQAFVLNDRFLKGKIEIAVKEFNVVDSYDFMLYEIEEYNPDVIGFSCYAWNIERILELTHSIKKLWKNKTIVLGGPHVSPIATTVLEQNECVDIVVRGEGEVTFTELIKSLLRSRRDSMRLKGITQRFHGKIIENADRENISELDSIPFPYRTYNVPLESREVCLETQRGCFFKCHFCYYNKEFKKVRFFGMQRVKSDLLALLAKKPYVIYLMDPVFNADIKRAKEICRFIAAHNKDRIMFHTEIRAEYMDEELSELFYNANIKYVEIGLQSVDGGVSRLINRKSDLTRFTRGFNLLKKYDLVTEIQLILGLPGDTVTSFKRSLAFALDLNPTKVAVFPLRVLPGTELWKNAEKLGIIFQGEETHYFLQSRSLSFRQNIELWKIVNSVNLFRDLKMTKFLCEEARISLLLLVKAWIDWLGNDSRTLLNTQTNEVLKRKVSEFVKYFCAKKKLNFTIYSVLLQQEEEFSYRF